MKFVVLLAFLTVALYVFQGSDGQYQTQQYQSPRYPYQQYQSQRYPYQQYQNQRYPYQYRRPRPRPVAPRRPGRCPNTQGIAGICVQTARNCRGDYQCGPHRKCCRIGCGSECLHVVY